MQQQTRRRADGRADDSRVHGSVPRAENRYRTELAAAIVDFVAFHPSNQELAVEIADGAARQSRRGRQRPGWSHANPVHGGTGRAGGAGVDTPPVHRL